MISSKNNLQHGTIGNLRTLYDFNNSFNLEHSIFDIDERRKKEYFMNYLPHIILETPDEFHSHISKFVFSTFQVHYDLNLKA